MIAPGDQPGEDSVPDPLMRVERLSDVRSPRRMMWLALASLVVVVPLIGWAETRAYTAAHGAGPSGPGTLLLWAIGLGG